MARPEKTKLQMRIPLAGVQNSRIVDDSFVEFSSSGIVGIGSVGEMIVGFFNSSDKDQRFINVIFDKIKNALTGKETIYVCKRPGFSTHTTPQAGSIGTAVRVWASQGGGTKVISAFGGTNSTIYDGTTDLGDITGRAVFLDEATVSSTPTILIPSTDGTAWYYQDGGSPTKISDADFPGNAGRTITGHFVAVDGYLFIMDTGGRIYNSDLNSVTSWTSTSFLTAQMYPDKGVGLARYKDQIVAFGKETIEFFHITDNVDGSPLARTQQAFIRIGCASEKGYTQMEDTIAWVSTTDRGGCSIYKLDGFQAKRISTATIDAQLALAGPNNVRVSCVKMLGKTFIFAYAGTLTFAYQLEDDIWTQWSSGAPLWSDISVATAGSWQVYTVSDLRDSGKVYTINPSAYVYTDDGSSYTMTIQTSKLDFDTNDRKFYHRLEFIGDVQSSTTTLNVSWSDDDYQTWSTVRTVDLSSNRSHLTQLGSARRRAFKFTNSSNVPIRLEAIEVSLTVGNK